MRSENRFLLHGGDGADREALRVQALCYGFSLGRTSRLVKNTIIDTSIGERIRARRKTIGMTQVELASSLGISFQQVQKYERGLSGISPDRLAQICHTLSLPASYFDEAGLLYIGKAIEPSHRQTPDDTLSNEKTGFIESPEGQRLICGFIKIRDPQLRTRIIDFIISLTSA